MQLQGFNIMDACTLNSTTLCFRENVAPSLQYIPEEQFTVSVMLNTSPLSHFYSSLLHSHSYTQTS